MRWSVPGWLIVSGLVSLELSGCGTPAPPKPSAPPLQGVQIAVGAVGDPAILATVDAQRGEWEASRGASCLIQKEAVDPASTGAAHVVVFRADRLGDFVDAQTLIALPESLVRPPARAQENAGAGQASQPGKDEPEELDVFQFNDVIPAFREQVSKYGRDRMAFPYGGSALVLAYRPEAFERKENRDAARKAGIGLEPPTAWEQLDGLAKFFQGRDWSGDGANDYGISLALGADAEGVGDSVYLARAASLGQHRDQYSLVFNSDTMEPRISSPPFVEALQGLVALKSCGPPGIETFDAEAARKAFRKGNVAMLIDRAERSSTWSDGSALVSLAVLPGSMRVYDPTSKAWKEQSTSNRPSYLPFGGGWLVGVAASAQGREREAAIDFARYLVNPETSSRVRSDRAFPMLPVRSSQVGQGLPDPSASPGVDSRLWSDAVSRTLTAARVVPGLRIPQAEGYLADLSKGRVAAVNGKPAEKALQGVAEAWTARTKALGVARQVWHYQKSLNSIITSPQPPPR